MIYIKNDRSVFPNNVKVSNQYENETRTIQFDLSDVQFTGNTYLICKYQNNQDFYAPLLLDSNFSIPVETFLSAQAGTYSCVIAISTATIGPDYDFSTDNPLFVSNIFTLTVDANFLTGTSTSWQLTPAAQNYFDQLIALVEKVQSDLDSGAFVGNGIQSITKISTSGLVDTYQITFTNGSTFDYQVTNGQNGQTPTITIQDGYWYINGVNTGQQAQGEKGDKGDAGDNATIVIGTVTTLEPDQEATVQNTGTETNAVLAFGIPKGETGATGPQGPQGAPGVNLNVLHADISKSENPSVDDAYEAPLQDLKFYGKSTQVNTTGKNLWDISKVTTKEYSNGTGIVNNGDGTLTVTNSTGDSSVLSDQKLSDICPGLQIDETYTLSGIASGTTNGKIYLSEIKLAWAFGSYKVITQEMLDSYVRFYADKGGNTDTVSNLQMEKGSTATTYEPYTGGKPSPSPDYPQEITCVEEVDCLITGANLFDISTSEDGSIRDGQETALQGYKRSDYIPVTPGGTISRTPQDITKISGNFFYDIDKNFLTKISSSSSSAIAVPENAYYYRFVFNNTLTELMVNVGETLLPYEPYKSQHVQFTPPAPLYSLLDGSVADVVNVQSGQYEYNMKFITLNGTESTWYKYKDLVNGGIAVALSNWANGDDIFHLYNQKDNYYLIENFRYSNIDNSKNPVGEFLVNKNDSGGSWIVFTVAFSTLEEFIAWLKENPITVGYATATPTEQDIPAETLEALQALKTFNGVTNIFCNAPVSFQYEQSLQIVIQNIWNAIGQTNANILLNGGNN